MREYKYKADSSTDYIGSASGGYRRKTNVKSYNVTCYHHNNMTELANLKIPSCNSESYRSQVLNQSGTNWFGCRGNGKEVMARVQEGDAGWHKEMSTLAKRIMPDLAVGSAVHIKRRRKRRRGDNGMSLDMDRVYQGNLDTAWTRMEMRDKETRSNRSAAIYVDLAASGAVRASQTVWRGAAAMAACDMLIKKGYSVKIYVGLTSAAQYSNEGTVDATCHTVMVKDYTTHLVPEMLASYCHIAFFRSFGFKMIFSPERKTGWGLGSPLNEYNIMPEDFVKDAKIGTMVVRIGADAMSEQAAKNVLNRLAEDLLKDREAA